MSQSPHLSLGRAGEQAAEKELKRLGYRILERNYKVRTGEIDLIATDQGELVFVEVKTRCPGDFGHPAEFVDGLKRRKLAHAALHYIAAKRLGDVPCRFDVVCVVPDPEAGPVVEVIRSAFVVE